MAARAQGVALKSHNSTIEMLGTLAQSAATKIQELLAAAASAGRDLGYYIKIA
jgi:hypothetical protein